MCTQFTPLAMCMLRGNLSHGYARLNKSFFSSVFYRACSTCFCDVLVGLQCFCLSFSNIEFIASPLVDNIWGRLNCTVSNIEIYV